MQAVISVLDEHHRQQVVSIWEELEREFHIRATSERVSFAHFTYQGAHSYEEMPLRAALRQVAGETDPFEVETDGIGIFTGPNPVLYIPVVRSSVLSQIHQRLWQALETVGVGVTPTYGPRHWIPHITLAQGDISHTHLPAVMQMLSARTFSWRIPITSLTVIRTSRDAPDAVYTIASEITFKRDEET